MEIILAQCSQWLVGQGSLFASVVMAGVMGSLTHCSAMCGPMVVTQALWLQEQPVSVSRALLVYHAGRLTTYAGLGVLAAAAGGWMFGGSHFASVSGALLLSAGVLFVVSALAPRAVLACKCRPDGRVAAFLQWLEAGPYLQAYVRGVLLGFMPCGLVLAALMLVAASHDALAGAVAMLVFGLATMPVLQLIGLGSLRLAPAGRRTGMLLGRGAMTVNGLLLCVLGAYRL